MRVTANPNPELSTSIEGTGKVQRPQKPTAKNSQVSSQARGASLVQISDDAKLMQQAEQIARSAPDMNLAKVEELQQRIRQGTYRVDSDKMADRLLEEHLSTHFGKNQI